MTDQELDELAEKLFDRLERISVQRRHNAIQEHFRRQDEFRRLSHSHDNPRYDRRSSAWYDETGKRLT